MKNGTRGEQEDTERFALRLRALGHPARLRILAALAEINACQCGDIVRELPLAQSTVSEHLRVLKKAGLVRGDTDSRRACYCLDHDVVQQLAEDFDRLFAMIGRDKEPVRKGRRAQMRGKEART
jgi:ArsR family transcriptional regulator